MGFECMCVCLVGSVICWGYSHAKCSSSSWDLMAPENGLFFLLKLFIVVDWWKRRWRNMLLRSSLNAAPQEEPRSRFKNSHKKLYKPCLPVHEGSRCMTITLWIILIIGIAGFNSLNVSCWQDAWFTLCCFVVCLCDLFSILPENKALMFQSFILTPTALVLQCLHIRRFVFFYDLDSSIK